MKPRNRPHRRTRQGTDFGSWASAMLALAPLSALVWAVQATGIGIA